MPDTPRKVSKAPAKLASAESSPAAELRTATGVLMFEHRSLSMMSVVLGGAETGVRAAA